MAAISTYRLEPLSTGAIVIGGEDPERGTIITAKVLSENEVIELFCRFIDMAEIGKRCRFMCTSVSQDSVTSFFELGVRGGEGFSKPMLTVVCQAKAVLPSVSRLEGERFPWFLSVYNLFHSAEEASPDQFIERAYSNILARVALIDHCHRGDMGTEIPDRNQQITGYFQDYCRGLSENEKRIESSVIRQEAIGKAGNKPLHEDYFEQNLQKAAATNKLAFSKVVILQGNRDAPREDYASSPDWRIAKKITYPEGGATEIYSRSPISSPIQNIARQENRFMESYPEVTEAEENLFAKLHKMQEKRRLELQKEVIGELPKAADQMNPALVNLLGAILSEDGIEHYAYEELVMKIEDVLKSFL